MCHLNGDELRVRQDQLAEQLKIGECCGKDKEALLQLLCSNHHVFALTDTELGETDLVEHDIVTVDNQPVRVSSPRRLPYALRTELAGEIIKLLYTECIEASNSPYASGLFLVRKKDGGLTVCINYLRKLYLTAILFCG